MQAMHTPPLPGIIEHVLRAAARLEFRAVVRDASQAAELGVFFDGSRDWHLFIASGGVDGTWALADSLPDGFFSVLISPATYDVLHSGHLNADGTILYGEKTFRLRIWHDGSHMTAQAIEA